MSEKFPIRFVSAFSEESVQNSRYFWNNALRTRGKYATIQRTLSGRGVFEYQGTRYEVGEGKAFLFTTPEESKYYYPEEFQEEWKFSWVTFSGAKEWLLRLRDRFGSVIGIAKEGETAEIMADLAKRSQADQFRDPLHASELVYRLLISLERELIHQEAADPIERAIEYIRLYQDSPYSVKELANHYGMSREHFIRAFKKRHGISPGVLMRKNRLNRARSLIQTTRISVDEVARVSGYSDASSFARAFRQEFNMSPQNP